MDWKRTICEIVSWLIFVVGIGFDIVLALALRATRDYDWATLGNAFLCMLIFIVTIGLGMYIRKVGGCKPLNLD